MTSVLNLFHILTPVYQLGGALQNSLTLLNQEEDCVLSCALVDATDKAFFLSRKTILMIKKNVPTYLVRHDLL